jgi:hypothetical protein
LAGRFAALLGTDVGRSDNCGSVKTSTNVVGNHIGWDIFQNSAGASTLKSIINFTIYKKKTSINLLSEVFPKPLTVATVPEKVVVASLAGGSFTVLM